MAEKDKLLKNIFVVIDPTSEEQPALTRAVDIAKNYDARVHAYVGIYSKLETDEPEELEKVEKHRYQLWLETLIEPLRGEGVSIDEYIDWTPDWRQTMSDVAQSLDSDIIIKPSTRRKTKSRVAMTSSDMALFESAHCPIMLTSGVKKPNFKILAAVDVRRTNERYRTLADSILEMGRRIVDVHADEGGELHVVYAYDRKDDYRHVTDVAHATDLPAERVHVISGDPESAVTKVAKELDAYLVIIGLSTDKPVANRLFGATSDWILNNIDHDILVMM
jgi:universal stress protein E